MRQIRKTASLWHEQFVLCPFGFEGGVVLSSSLLSMHFICLVSIFCKLSACKMDGDVIVRENKRWSVSIQFSWLDERGDPQARHIGERYGKSLRATEDFSYLCVFNRDELPGSAILCSLKDRTFPCYTECNFP